MGSAGIAAADDGDLSGDLSVGNQNMNNMIAQDSDSWIFRSGGDESGGEHAGGDHTKSKDDSGDHAKGKGVGGNHGK